MDGGGGEKPISLGGRKERIFSFPEADSVQSGSGLGNQSGRSQVLAARMRVTTHTVA